MTRLANIEKAGYFPTPPAVTESILSYISAPRGGRILDPCAGKGVALLHLADRLALKPYGVELNEERAQLAQQAVDAWFAPQLNVSPRLAHILTEDFRYLETTRQAFNLLFLNPPYAWDTKADDKAAVRLEYQWLWRMRPFLQIGGLLVYIIPQHILGRRKIATYLSAHFAQLRLFRFPDGLYERFRQVVVFGRRRPKSVPPNSATVDRLHTIGRLTTVPPATQLPQLTPAAEPYYELPAPVVPHKRFVFRSRYVDPQAALTEARRVGIATQAAWRSHLDPSYPHAALQPLTPLKIGHMHSIIAAGHLNNQLLINGDERLLIKGRSYKTTRQAEFSEALPSGGRKITTLETEVVVTDITTVAEDGSVAAYSGAKLETFLARWLPHLTAIVAQTYTPVYRFDLNGYGDVLNHLSQQRPIPGLNGACGLLPAQKHAAAAVLTGLENQPDAIVVGEMGCGKSTIGAAVAAGLNGGKGASRTLILCPPHLVEKWQRECRAVWPTVVTMHLQTLHDVNAFFAQRRDKRPVIGVLKQTTARSASGWEHTYDYGGGAAHTYGSKGVAAVRRQWQGSTRTKTQQHAIHKRGVCCPTCGCQQMINGRPLAPSELRGAKRFCENPSCRSALFQFKRKRTSAQAVGTFATYAQRERQWRRWVKGIASQQPAPLAPPKQRHGYGKVPLAGYIKQVARGRLDLVVIDEQHQYKGADSDQGYAMHHLAQAAHKVVGLTGTIYGGKASSLFHLLYRTSPEVAAAYTNRQAHGSRRIRSKDWVSAYGILQRIETRKVDEHGMQTANSRTSVRYKELPGGSPAMLPWLLNRAVFLSLNDMGFPLPAYEEVPVEVALAPAQALLYEELKTALKAELKERLVRGDKSLLSGYLYALLFWPDAPHRPKVIRDPHTDAVIAAVPALPNGFVAPKEREIIDLCQREQQAGRNVLLLCMQTDTLDIQPRWQTLLADADLKAAILRAAPNKREGWVAKQVAAGVDVIISHPKKIETGIDLLDFPTIVWMAPHYSVYTVLQASRRSWRIGQTQPVKVYYFAYADTLQTQALALVAAKVAAALRVNGDTVTDAALAELDGSGGDLVATLAKIVTGDVTLAPNSLQQAFAKANTALQEANTVIGDYGLQTGSDRWQAAKEDTEQEIALQRRLPIAADMQQLAQQLAALLEDASALQHTSKACADTAPLAGKLGANGVMREAQTAIFAHLNLNAML